MIPRMLHGAMGQALVNGGDDAVPVLEHCRKGAAEQPLASYCILDLLPSKNSKTS